MLQQLHLNKSLSPYLEKIVIPTLYYNYNSYRSPPAKVQTWEDFDTLFQNPPWAIGMIVFKGLVTLRNCYRKCKQTPGCNGQEGYAFSQIFRATSSSWLCDICAPRPPSWPSFLSSVEYLILTEFSNRCYFLLCLWSVSLLYFSGVFKLVWV